MTRYVLDTNVLIYITRDAKPWKYIDAHFQPFTPPNEAYISFVSLAEIMSLARRNGWGNKKMSKLAEVLTQITRLDFSPDLIQHYIEIDSYSDGKHPVLRLPEGISARNMGKHDIWIAATAIKANAEIITTDRDFLHLSDIFCKVHYIDVYDLPDRHN